MHLCAKEILYSVPLPWNKLMMPFDFEIVSYLVVVSATTGTGMSSVKSTSTGNGISITMFTCNRFKS